ncbi:8683_t:CDS:1, partial [Entrophospora sp. SA101]
MFGPCFRIFISLPVKIKQEVKNVHFLIDTGSPKKFICKEVYESFKATTLDSSAHRVLINNNPTIAQLPPINS